MPCFKDRRLDVLEARRREERQAHPVPLTKAYVKGWAT